MGSRPHAVLVYGYDLTANLFDYDAPTPAWFNDEDASWCDNAERALLNAKGIMTERGWIDSDEVLDLCGVVLVRLDNDGDDQGVLLAAKKHETDWDTNMVIPHFVLPEDADERLHWALGVLGIDRGERVPEWILAAYHS